MQNNTIHIIGFKIQQITDLEVVAEAECMYAECDYCFDYYE